MKEKVVVLDVETTGTDPKENGVVQIGGFVIIDGRIENKFDFECRPFQWDKIDPEALEVIGKTKDELADLPDPKEAYDALTDILSEHVDKYDKKDKFHFVAYNADFDWNFMWQWFDKNGDKYFGSYFWYPPIDIMKLVGLRYMHRRTKFKNYKLMTVCKTLGMEIDPEKAHDAFYDVECTYKLFKAMRKMTGWNKSA